LIDAIVCARDPTPHLNLCLTALERQRGISKILVVTHIKSHNCRAIANSFSKTKVITEPEHFCLAYARKLGVETSNSDFIVFVDSDVILGRDHLIQLKDEYERLSQKYTDIVVEGVLESFSTSPLSLASDRSTYEAEVLKAGDRGFTHNTLVKRDTLIDWKPRYTYAMEDLLITNHVFSKGGVWYRFKQEARSFHIAEANQFNRASSFSAANRILGLRKFADVLYRAKYYSIYGIVNTIIRRDIKWLVHCFSDSAGQIVGHLAWNKYMEMKK